jgi:hypothetical protein
MIISNELFSLDCYRLASGSYDMVFDVHWLESLGPILWDFCSRMIRSCMTAMVCSGQRPAWPLLPQRS